MEFIIEFYKGLDTLNSIIFWGIIIVIILLLIFSLVLINKNKKLKTLVDNQIKEEEELPIKKEDTIPENIKREVQYQNNDNSLSTYQERNDNNQTIKQEDNNKHIETEKKFIAEEHVMEYNKDLFSLPSIKKANEYEEEKTNYEVKIENTIIQKRPTEPYQRNVLREMSLSQTSPIGINRQNTKEAKKIDSAKNLEEPLKTEIIELFEEKEQSKDSELIKNQEEKINNQIKQELVNVEKDSPRKTEIRQENIIDNTNNYKSKSEQKHEVQSTSTITTTQSRMQEIQNRKTSVFEERPKTSSEQYLEEVSRKLAEAETPDEIERTNYELKQEEDAIISYKELMEKKDSIQTIDEEDAVISIEELMNHHNQNNKKTDEDDKLYKLSEEEENDNFIKELKQFRNDL